MKFPNQAKLLQKTRKKYKLTQAAISQLVGLPYSANFIRNVEHGVCAMPANRWSRLKKFVDRDTALKAHLADIAQTWNGAYDDPAV